MPTYLTRLMGAAICLSASALATAHIGGATAIDQYFALVMTDAEPGAGAPAIHYRMHMGEIASFRDFSALDPDMDGVITEAEEAEYLSLRVPLLVNGLSVSIDGDDAPLELTSQRVALNTGETGLEEISIILTLSVGGEPLAIGPEGIYVELVSRNMRAFSGNYEMKLLLDGRGYEPVKGEEFGFRHQEVLWVDAEGAPTLINLQPQFAFRILPGASEAAADITPLLADLDAADTGLLQPAPRPERDAPAPMFPAITPVADDAPMAGAAPIPPPAPASPVETMGQERERERAQERDWFAARLTSSMREDDLTPMVFLVGLLIAIGMGMGHAFSPGHGKTVMAAYLIGERGTYWHAFLLGVIVTATHTWSVLLLGLVVLYFSESASTEVIQFWTGIASGLIILVLGMLLFRVRYGEYLAARMALAGHGHAHHHHHGHDHDHHHHHHHGHDHDHDHHHHHHGHDHDHHHHHPFGHGWLGHDHHDGPGGHSHVIPGKDGKPPSFWSIFFLGISGGIVPCPAALIVLLLAIRLGQLTYGLALIVAFSVGLAAVLIAIGFVVVKTAGAVRERSGGMWLKALPVASSVLITLLGGWVVLWTLMEYNIIIINLGG